MEADPLALLERTPIKVWNEDLDQFLAKWEVQIPSTRMKELQSELDSPFPTTDSPN